MATLTAGAGSAATPRRVLGLWEPVGFSGMGVSGIVDAAQLDLFDRSAAPRDTRLDHALDSLRDRFGHAAPRRGGAPSLRDLDFRGEDLRSETRAA